MRRAAKTDANHAAIVGDLRRVGCTVHSLAAVGDGCPDLLVGRAGRTWLLEVKDGGKSPSCRRLTADQRAWHLAWRGGPLEVVESVADALAVVMA